jgi:hypothetical protein
MSKVLTFSRFFLKGHPKEGQPTYFVEKIIKGLMNLDCAWYDIDVSSIFDREFYFSDECKAKYHTIRSGQHWKVGDRFSPRVWSGTPRRSRQIVIAPEVEVKATWRFDIDTQGIFYLNGYMIDLTCCDIPQNDGLSLDDFLAWFPVGESFDGQIICWSDAIDYKTGTE